MLKRRSRCSWSRRAPQLPAFWLRQPRCCLPGHVGWRCPQTRRHSRTPVPWSPGVASPPPGEWVCLLFPTPCFLMDSIWSSGSRPLVSQTVPCVPLHPSSDPISLAADTFCLYPLELSANPYILSLTILLEAAWLCQHPGLSHHPPSGGSSAVSHIPHFTAPGVWVGVLLFSCCFQTL